MLVKRHHQGRVAVLTIERPEARNALSRAVVAALLQELAAVCADETTSAIVIASSGKVFLSGGDLKELSALPFDQRGAAQVSELGHRLAAIENCALPVIAAVDGPTFGGGCELLLMCDLAVMSASASLAFVHARMGLTPAWGGATRLIERIGSANAADLLLSARTIDASEALRMGLAQRVVPSGEALQSACALAESLAGAERDALIAMKHALLASKKARRGSAHRDETAAFQAAWGSGPHQRAFGKLRPPTQR